MKKKIIIFFVLSITMSFSQIKNGTVTYGVIKHKPDPKNTNETFVREHLKTEAITPLLQFTLNFNKDESYFFLNEISIPDDHSLSVVLSNINISNSIYENKKRGLYRWFVNDYLVGDVVFSNRAPYTWSITSETKLINGYTCYKATAAVVNDFGYISRDKEGLVAWFAPEIPAYFGPNGYRNLPGLILEFTNYNSTIYAQYISLNLEKEPEIKRLDTFREIKKQQYLQIMLDSMSPELRKRIEETHRKLNEKMDKLE